MSENVERIVIVEGLLDRIDTSTSMTLYDSRWIEYECTARFVEFTVDAIRSGDMMQRLYGKRVRLVAEIIEGD